MDKRIKGSKEMEYEGETFARSLSPQSGHATLVGLSGELGSGKTTFVKGVAQGLGVTLTVTSPTFVIEKVYKLEKQSFKYLVHVDAYRLESGDELIALGFNDLKSDPGNLIIIEWPERVRGILPLELKMLHFVFLDNSTRSIRESEHGKD